MQRILFAEDKVSYHQEVVDTLRKAGYDVTAVMNASDAIDALQHNLFDIVITDWCMPHVGDGMQVVQEAQRKGITKIIVNSAMAEEIEAIAGIEIVSKMSAGTITSAVKSLLAE